MVEAGPAHHDAFKVYKQTIWFAAYFLLSLVPQQMTLAHRIKPAEGGMQTLQLQN